MNTKLVNKFLILTALTFTTLNSSASLHSKNQDLLTKSKRNAVELTTIFEHNTGKQCYFSSGTQNLKIDELEECTVSMSRQANLILDNGGTEVAILGPLLKAGYSVVKFTGKTLISRPSAVLAKVFSGCLIGGMAGTALKEADQSLTEHMPILDKEISLLNADEDDSIYKKGVVKILNTTVANPYEWEEVSIAVLSGLSLTKYLASYGSLHSAIGTYTCGLASTRTEFASDRVKGFIFGIDGKDEE